MEDLSRRFNDIARVFAITAWGAVGLLVTIFGVSLLFKNNDPKKDQYTIENLNKNSGVSKNTTKKTLKRDRTNIEPLSLEPPSLEAASLEKRSLEKETLSSKRLETVTFETASEKEAILTTIDNFFEALATSNADAVERLVSVDANTITVFPENDGRPPRHGRVRALSDSMRLNQAPKIEEPYWDPIVLQRKGLAVVWAPYEVWVNERLSHCGIDVFTLSYQKTAWIINSVQWTQEPSACEELWPEGRSVLRPSMFNEVDE